MTSACSPAQQPDGHGVHPFWRGPTISSLQYEIRIEQRDTLFAARVTGELPIELFLSTLHVLGIESDGASERAMLADLRQLSTPYGRADLVRVGEEIAVSFGHMRRVALLVLPRQVTRISERSAQRNGLNLRVFDAESQAFAWLVTIEDQSLAQS